jgi:FtsH-binding integral membrane protein
MEPCAYSARILNYKAVKNDKQGGNSFMKKGWGMASFILFCIGLVLAVVGGLVMPESAIIAMVLVVFGLIIGIIHVVYAKDVTDLHTLLLATIALLVMAAAFAPITLMGAGKIIGSMLVNFAALMAPVALVAAIKALLKIGLEK